MSNRTNEVVFTHHILHAIIEVPGTLANPDTCDESEDYKFKAFLESISASGDHVKDWERGAICQQVQEYLKDKKHTVCAVIEIRQKSGMEVHELVFVQPQQVASRIPREAFRWKSPEFVDCCRQVLASVANELGHEELLRTRKQEREAGGAANRNPQG